MDSFKDKKQFKYGVYGYICTSSREWVYIGVDCNIDKDARHKDHNKYSCKDEQPINKALHEAKNGIYEYQTIATFWLKDDAYEYEKQKIREYNPKFNILKYDKK